MRPLTTLTKMIKYLVYFSDSMTVLIVSEKLKMNVGYLSFKRSKGASPIKFAHKNTEDSTKESEVNKYFKQNPHLAEFKRTGKGEEKITMEQKKQQDKKKKKKEKNMLKTSNKFSGSNMLFLHCSL